LAREPDLIAAIRRDLEAVGLVGEQDNGLLTYKIFSSRIQEKPGAVVTRGASGTGKTTLLNKVAVLFPSDCKIEAMNMSPASWFNTSEVHFKHKIFLAGERKHAQDDGSKDAGALLRQLLSERRVNRGVSTFDETTKGWRTEFVEREGPVAYAESTTSGSVFEEDLNRMLQLCVDESEGQTRKVVESIGSEYDPEKAPVDLKFVIDRHHEFQQSLRPYKVLIPYWKTLAERLPAKKVECRRVAQQVFTVIEAAVLLTQHCRPERDGCLTATVDDYALARRLLLAPLHASLGVGKDYQNALRLKAKVRKFVFSTPDVKQALGFDNDMGPSRLLKGLVEAALLVRLTEQKGRTPATYKWAGKAGPDLESMVLPSVAAIREAGFT
jgi:energy-coupling factor transporter ATP-binding protein EcfA2